MRSIGGIAMLVGVAVLATALVMKKVYAPVAVAAVAPPVPAPVAVPPPPLAAKPTPSTEVPAPSRQEIAAQVERSVVHLRCGDQAGAGFFIAPDQLVTNAHVLCTGKPLVVTLKDGRNLLGTVSAKDDWLDLARLDVPGADADPLPIGDTTALRAGDEVGFIGSPKGLSFTVHGGRVSHVGRGLYGVAYVQLEGQVNPGNSGGPMFDAEGRVLGLVSMKVVDSDGIGLALPIEYARAPVEGPALERWQQTLKRVEEEDVRARVEEAQRMAPGKPRLVAVQRVEARGIAGVVMQRWTDTPHALLQDFTLTQGGAECLVRASTTGWVPLPQAIERAQDPRRVAWMIKHRLADGVYVGAGILEPIDCPADRLTGEAQLSVKGDGAKLSIDAADLKTPLAQKQEQAAARAKQEQHETQQAAADEARWRAKFRELRARIAQLEADIKEAQKWIAYADQVAGRRRGQLTPELRERYNQARDVMARAPGQKTAAEADLHELERQAANEAVPLEWRR